MTDPRQTDAAGELLMQHATGQASAAEADALARTPLPATERAAWELAAGELAALLHAEQAGDAAQLPAALAQRIVADGEAVVRTLAPTAPPTAAPTIPRARAAAPVVWGGWLAAAAALLLWVVAPRPRDRAPVAASPAMALAALRDTLQADVAGARTVTWRAAGDATGRGARGEVTWHAARQAGVMRFVGLAANDPRRWQYQLWIFDRRRDQRYPVDGGVFDVPPGAREVLVRIDPRVPVGEAVAFAVTVEPPGGVVVSTRERVALLADGAE